MTVVLRTLSAMLAIVTPMASAEGARFAVPAAATASSASSVGGGAVQVLISLGIVIGAIVLLGWLARRLRVMPRGRSGALRVVDELPLGAKERAVLLEVDGVRLVLGVGEGRVALLHRGDEPAQSAPLDAPSVASGTEAMAPRFGELLQKALGR